MDYNYNYNVNQHLHILAEKRELDHGELRIENIEMYIRTPLTDLISF